ncbi:MAG: bifunctional adenosylcobinamide kinase/adenosylcobinamide-phosphate guanylyltransferase [Anaerolineae bacterium]|nr:bifunctional adenosylcobinamide kinase/adenosylcobinamide-phosphate guanylyltransferase [Anaerolineae bacterium]
MGELILLLGGARSGKSHYAETWAKDHGQTVLFVATAQIYDEEMRERIEAHRATRPPEWHTLEAPLWVSRAVAEASLPTPDTVIVDCLTLLTSNALLALPEDCTQAEADAAIMAQTEDVWRAVQASEATWLVVTNEVGMGVVPPYRLGRFYRDALGRANQWLAQRADRVLLLVAGLPWALKG